MCSLIRLLCIQLIEALSPVLCYFCTRHWCFPLGRLRWCKSRNCSVFEGIPKMFSCVWGETVTFSTRIQKRTQGRGESAKEGLFAKRNSAPAVAPTQHNRQPRSLVRQWSRLGWSWKMASAAPCNPISIFARGIKRRTGNKNLEKMIYDPAKSQTYRFTQD